MEPITELNSEGLTLTAIPAVIMIRFSTIVRVGVFIGRRAGTGDFLTDILGTIVLITMIRSIIPTMTMATMVIMVILTIIIIIMVDTGPDIITDTGMVIMDPDITAEITIVPKTILMVIGQLSVPTLIIGTGLEVAGLPEYLHHQQEPDNMVQPEGQIISRQVLLESLIIHR